MEREKSPKTAQLKLKRDFRRESLTRLEDAARTPKDFQNVVRQWNYLDRLRERRERRHEIGRPSEEMLHWDKESDDDEKGAMKSGLDTVIPPPFGGHIWWRQMLRGDFLDTIFNSPEELHNLTSSRNVSELVEALRDDQKIILYLRSIRLQSPQRIAAIRKQTDRNIRKVYNNMIEQLRWEMFNRLIGIYERKDPLTQAQRAFVGDYLAKQGEMKHKRWMGKRKTPIDGG